MVVVSRVRAEEATFLDDWEPSLNIDFHAGWLVGLVGERGWTGRGECWVMMGLTFSVFGPEWAMAGDSRAEQCGRPVGE